jgi:hypothetical protein
MPPAAQQHEFDFLVPTQKELLRPDEVARILSQSEDFVYRLRDEGRLECHSHPAREVKRFRVTRRSLLAYLVESAEYISAHHTDRLLACLRRLPPTELQRVKTVLAKI